MSPLIRSSIRASSNRFYSTATRYTRVPSLQVTETESLDTFDPSEPVVFKKHFTHLPAITKWFTWSDISSKSCELNMSYLQLYGDSMVQVEARRGSPSDPTKTIRFERFETPLDVFLAHMAPFPATDAHFYLAQHPITDLPAALEADLPVPALLSRLGRGDIYASSIWMGKPPTRTPLHRDPNPNLFVQLAGQKVVKLMKPVVGRGLYEKVRMELGRASAGRNLRGEEMMEGEEMEALERAVWGDESGEDGREDGVMGMEAELGTGDGLYIPLGWWHAVRGIGTGANASANWWFR